MRHLHHNPRLVSHAAGKPHDFSPTVLMTGSCRSLFLLLGRKPANEAEWAKHSFQEQVSTHHLQFNAWECSSQYFGLSILALTLDKPFPSPLFIASIKCSSRTCANIKALCVLSHRDHSTPRLPQHCCQRAILSSLSEKPNSFVQKSTLTAWMCT